MSNTDTDTTDAPETEFDPDDLYRTDAAATFAGHLFKGADVRSAGVENGDKATHPVPTLCSRRTDKGPFDPIAPAEIRNHAEREVDDDAKRDLCQRCVSMAARRLDDEAEPPFDPSEFTVADLTTKLDDEGITDEVTLNRLRDAEAEGKDRTTAIDAILARIDEGDHE